MTLRVGILLATALAVIRPTPLSLSHSHSRNSNTNTNIEQPQLDTRLHCHYLYQDLYQDSWLLLLQQHVTTRHERVHQKNESIHHCHQESSINYASTSPRHQHTIKLTPLTTPPIPGIHQYLHLPPRRIAAIHVLRTWFCHSATAWTCHVGVRPIRKAVDRIVVSLESLSIPFPRLNTRKSQLDSDCHWLALLTTCC